MKKVKVGLFLITLLALVLGCKITPSSDSTTNVTTSFENKPGAVTSVTVPNVVTTNDGVPVSWSFVEDSDGYYIYYQTANDYVKGKEPLLEVKTKGSTSHTFTNLNKAERYVFWVTPYKIANGKIITGDPSERKECATTPTMEVAAAVQNQKATLYFSTSERSSVLHAGETIYNPLFIIREDRSDSVEEPEVIQWNDTKWQSNELGSNSKVYYTVNLNISNNDIMESKKEFYIENPPNYYPTQPRSISTVNAEKGKITINWEAAPINGGIEGTSTQYFSITRKNLKTNEIVSILSERDTAAQPQPTGDDLLNYSFVDTTVESNTKYTYSVTPWYEIIKTEGGTATWFCGPNSIEAENAYSLPSPSLVNVEWTVPEANANIQDDKKYKLLDEAGNATYEALIKWTVNPFDETLVYDIKRIDVLDATETVIAENIAYSEEGYKDTLQLTAAQDMFKHEYKYAVVAKNVAQELSDEAYSENIPTVPSVTPIDFVSSATASEIKDNAGKVLLQWKPITDAELQSVDSSLSTQNISFEIRRGTSPSALTLVNTIAYAVDSSTGLSSYTDTGLEDGANLYYQIKAVYSQAGSTYDTHFTSISLDNVKTLTAVEEITATDNGYTDRIEITFPEVSDASGYVIEYKLAVESAASWTDATPYLTDGAITLEDGIGKASFTKDAGTTYAGRKYTFRVFATDSSGARTASAPEDQGSLFGPYGWNVTATYGTYGDKVLVTWDPIANASRYTVIVYQDLACTSEIYRERVQSTSYTFDSSKVTDTVDNPYALSHSYFFRVIPQKDGVDISTDLLGNPIEGAWLFPPQNVVASKADYKDMVKLTWDGVSGVTGYNIYRRKVGESNYTKIYYTQSYSFSDPTVETNEDYEYTVSSMKNSLESMPQTYFPVTDEEASNLGYVLSPPQTLSITEYSSSNLLYLLQFPVSKKATGYTIRTSNGTVNLTNSQIENHNGKSSGRDGYVEFTSDKKYVNYYFTRPTVVDNVKIEASVIANNSNAPLQSNNSSVANVSTTLPSYLLHTEVINLLHSVLKEQLDYADAEFENDWWPPTSSSVSTSYQNTYSYNGLTILSERGGTWSYKTRTGQGYMTFSNFTDSKRGLTINSTENIQVGVEDSSYDGSAGYLGNDNLLHLGYCYNTKKASGRITINLPYEFGQAIVQFGHIKVNGTEGSYTVTYRGTTQKVEVPLDVDPSVRALYVMHT